MRLLRLDLLAYGPFTGRTLPLDEGRFGLHVIVGPNEAGKSSALRALHCLFYGIPTQCSDAFVHAYPQLRIGAVLQDEQGNPLHLIRRKGVKDTLAEPTTPRSSTLHNLPVCWAGSTERNFAFGSASIITSWCGAAKT